MSSPRTRGGSAAKRTTGRASAARPSPARPAARGVFVQKPKSDVYVALLGVALGSLLLGSLLLTLYLGAHDFQINP